MGFDDLGFQLSYWSNGVTPVSWLEGSTCGEWPSGQDEPNPYIHYRRLLGSWSRAMGSGWTDHDFVTTVRDIDASIAGVDGRGFVTTPATWCSALTGGGASDRVFVKDETGNVGGSHKARHLMGLLLHLAVDAVANDTRLAIASCGNAAIGAATVARAAGRPIDVFIPTWADKAVVAVLKDLGAVIHVCDRRQGENGDPCMFRFREAVADGALAFGVQATENVWTLDGGRTIGWELADQIASEHVSHVLVQVGGGALLTSAAIGLLEAVSLDRLKVVPRVWAVQAEGNAPFDRAWRGLLPDGSVAVRLADAEARATELMTTWDSPKSAATGILDDLTHDWLGVCRSLLTTGGGSIVATEQDVLDAKSQVVSAGYKSDHTGAAGYAGLLAAVRSGTLRLGEPAAIFVTGLQR